MSAALDSQKHRQQRRWSAQVAPIVYRLRCVGVPSKRGRLGP